MEVAVFGGSFNPPHVGHALVASWLLWTGRVERVWLVPAFSHAFGKDLAPFEARVDLCRALAAVLGPAVEVHPLEAELPAPSYTLDTLRALAARHPEHRFRLVIGADVVPELPRWHRWEAIEAAFAPIVVGRQGWPTPPGAVDFPPVSSTEIRARLAADAEVGHLVPRQVLRALPAGLYRRP